MEEYINMHGLIGLQKREITAATQYINTTIKYAQIATIYSLAWGLVTIVFFITAVTSCSSHLWRCLVVFVSHESTIHSCNSFFFSNSILGSIGFGEDGIFISKRRSGSYYIVQLPTNMPPYSSTERVSMRKCNNAHYSRDRYQYRMFPSTE